MLLWAYLLDGEDDRLEIHYAILWEKKPLKYKQTKREMLLMSKGKIIILWLYLGYATYIIVPMYKME